VRLQGVGGGAVAPLEGYGHRVIKRRGEA